jgi:hypothetical protein
MKIVCIFEGSLYAFRYANETKNELGRLLKLWNDTSYLYRFVQENKMDLPHHKSVPELIEELMESAAIIDQSLATYASSKQKKLDELFKPLDNKEYRKTELSKQKSRQTYLRLYALRIDTNCFVITGGAIKFHHLMEDRVHTAKELQKIERCRNYLKANGINDNDSFYEFLIETT